MPSPSLPFKHRRPLLATAVALSLVICWLIGNHWTRVGFAQGNPPFRNFEATQVHPLALTPDGTRLLAVNSPNASLSVFQLVSGLPVLTAEIPVGLEPVSVAARNNSEAWVVNWLSDSVSIVNLTTGNVTRTIDVGDEPTDVLFAGPANARAFVCVSGGASLSDFSIDISQHGRGQVKIFDAADPNLPLQTLTLFGKQTRALARDASGSRVFVSVFESGNLTTIVPEATVTANGGLPPPNPPMDGSLPPAPRTGLIVKWNGSNWVDELSRSWNSFISYRLADMDVAVIDASTATATVAAEVHGVGTHNGNMMFDATTNRLAVVNLESSNAVRFEPNLRGRFQANRVTFINAQPGTTPSVASTVDLNSQIDLNSPGSDAERAQSLALPADITRGADGTIYVAATSSGRVGVLNSTGTVQTRIAVGGGPTGLALDETRQQLYVLNRFDQTVSVVNTNSKTQAALVGIGFNPEPPAVRSGRKFLYDSNLSRHGTVSCASCHPNGHRDGIDWDLGNPQGTVDIAPGPVGPLVLHPMKGPMMTQSLRGIIGTEPLHWRGDRPGLANFNQAFVSLLGGPRTLTAPELTDFTAFIQSLTYPPNPNEPVERPDVEERIGFSFFNLEHLDGGSTNSNGRLNCSDCHLITNFRSGTNNLIIPKEAIMEAQDVKVPQMRGLYQKIGMNKTGSNASGELTGFGFTHDGVFDTLDNFMQAPQFDFSSAGSAQTAASWRQDMTILMVGLDTGTAPAVGLMTTVTFSNKTNFNVTNRISELEARADASDCDVVVRGIYGGVPRSFLRLANGLYQADSLSEAPVSSQTLIDGINVSTGKELTFMGVPFGEGRLFGSDRDGNGILNDDEPRTSVQISGRVVDAAGHGIPGVTVTLSGKQSATTTTDGFGGYVFNFISTTGTHIITPQRSDLTFTPLSRSFTNPIWNVSATFTTSPTGSAADSPEFFVSQHYADFLSREPDAAGLAFWINQITECGADPDCRQARRDNVSGAFFLSIEFKETGYLVYRTYKASFGDLPGKPVPITFPQLMTDTQRVGRNVIVNVGNWQQQLEINKQAFFLGWVQRPEFLARYPVGMSAANFVDTLNANTGGSLTASERDALVNQLAANNTLAGRASAVRQVAENTEFSNREVNKAFVLMQYFGYLRRNPDDPPEAGLNFDGYNFWLTKLNEHNGNFIQAEMVKSFIVSSEYRGRFGQ